jgi:23S rRNA (guanosine2251-2'-O)-methyltransferase
LNYSTYHAVEEAVKNKTAGGILYIAKKNKRTQQLETEARLKGFQVKYTDELYLKEKLNCRENDGLVLVQQAVKAGRELELDDFLDRLESDNSIVLILDGITDPHNLGAILRSAHQFGTDLVVIPERRAAGVNETVMKTSAGAALYTDIAVETNLVRAIEKLKKASFWVYLADMDGSALFDTKLNGRIAVVLGSEGKGARSLVRQHCDAVISIPQYGKIDSLNVSVSAGIILYEIKRQSEIKKGS